MNYLENLNPEQQKAVLHGTGPAMIIAGAGSGKTRVLTYRIAHLIQNGVDAFNILSLTFTNKAAAEMRERIESVIGTEARNIWMGTFHSVFAKILRVEAHRLGYPTNFTIYDTDDSKTLIRQIVKERNLDDKVYKPSTVLNRISSAKNQLLTADEYAKNADFDELNFKANMPEIAKIFKIYQERCFKSGAMDFDDLLCNTYKLLNEHNDVLYKYQDKFKYIMVDEYQDTNFAQYLIIKRLAARFENIVVVGDDAQSIYAFRGADISNILNFERDYPDLAVFKLEQNYRSTDNIVQAANDIISRNTAQLPKNVWTENPTGEKIDVIKALSDADEARYISHSIFEAKQQLNLNYNDFAILYRTNNQSRSLEEALRRQNIEYRIVGGMSFYQRKEIKDLIAYLRLTVNPHDEQAIRRVINYPKRNIGDTTLTRLMNHAEEQGASLWDIVLNIKSFPAERFTESVDNFAQLIKSFGYMAKEKDAYEVAYEIAKLSGMQRELNTDKTVEGVARYENLQEVLNGIKEFVDNEENEQKDLGSFLQEIALLTNADDKDKAGGDKVTLMTVHSAKGLEFKYVYISGLEEDLFPSMMMLSSRADLEEERRLFYVAVTRAQERLTLSFATSRYKYGRLFSCEPSRFLREIDVKFLNLKTQKKPEPKPELFDKPTGSTGFSKINIQKKPIKTSYQTPSDFTPDDTSNLEAGMRIEHPKFGFGKVTRMDVDGGNRKAVIQFDEVGEKTLLLAFAKLKIH
jgi:DNA helicase II / ATP-dependent DNA helicase PcrA